MMVTVMTIPQNTAFLDECQQQRSRQLLRQHQRLECVNPVLIAQAGIQTLQRYRARPLVCGNFVRMAHANAYRKLPA